MHVHSDNSPDAEVEEVKCINKVMDEVVPDGIGSSDSDNGEMTINNINIIIIIHFVVTCVHLHTIKFISHNLLLQYNVTCIITHHTEVHSNDDKHHFILAPDFSSKPKQVFTIDHSTHGTVYNYSFKFNSIR